MKAISLPSAKADLNERLTIKNWYVLLGPPHDDPFQTIVEYYVSNDMSIPNERIIKEKTFSDILDLQDYKHRDLARHANIIGYIAGDLYHMGEFKKWIQCIPIYAVTSSKKLCGTVVADSAGVEYIIPIQLSNIDSYKPLTKRTTKWLTGL